MKNQTRRQKKKNYYFYSILISLGMAERDRDAVNWVTCLIRYGYSLGRRKKKEKKLEVTE